MKTYVENQLFKASFSTLTSSFYHAVIKKL